MIEIKNNDFSILVGNRFTFNDKKIRIYEFDGNTGNLKLAIDINGNGVDEITEEVSLSLGLDRFLKTLKDNYNLEIILTEGISYSIETIQKAHGLVLAGFNKLIRVENNYSVDNVFLQTFLLETELQHLLKDNVLELSLQEIK